ncbi:MAG: diguanylate cyclase [Acidovorax sp. SCN 65-28]|uniref:GGDEF domain-containing protein n=1 Tax=Acidovorax sp. TaxID=1872122 RepID=UPI00086B9E26|nr:GGDEF domain-containing protein [Acidovorax sp.]ODS69539.1 MAG: diguanylate cyclase [Acidovorax sp. SCN 65-28]OJU06952.1 MAG: GGDEF domain-containing protein [Acidovorax sp. 65-7]
MTNLDPRSMIALAGFMSAVMALVLLFMRRHYPPSIRGVGGWAAAPLLWLVSTVLFGARGAIPDWLGLVLANQLLVLGSVTYYMGTRQFMGQPATWRTWNWVMAGTTVVFVWLTYGSPSYALRVGFFTSVMAVLYAIQLRFMLRYGGRNFPERLVEVVLGLHMLVLTLRLGSILAGHAGSDLMEPSLFQTLYIGAYVLTVLMLSIGAVLMATDRLRTELEHLATYDSLTQTLNRRALLQRCEDELERAQRYGNGPSIMMVDLDNFKAVNDTRGHQHGDAVLVHFAERTREVLRRADRLGRYGGEEFLVLLPGADAQAALGVAQRIHATLATGHPLDCEVSIGLTSWTGPQETLDAMLSRADAALYRAKEEGRNRTVVG